MDEDKYNTKEGDLEAVEKIVGLMADAFHESETKKERSVADWVFNTAVEKMDLVAEDHLPIDNQPPAKVD